MTAKRFLVVGAGAIGCALAARLSAAGLDVALLARGAAIAVLREKGIVCEEPDRTLVERPAILDAAPDTPADVIFLTVKADALPAALAMVAPVIGPATIVVPMVNGIPWWFPLGKADPQPIEAVDPGGAMLARLPARAIAGAVVYTTSRKIGPNEVRLSSPQRLVLGALVPETEPAVRELVDMLSAAGILATLSADIRNDVWTKAALNLATNPLSVVSDATLRQQFSDPALLPLVGAVLDEVLRVAEAHGAVASLTRAQMIERGLKAGDFHTSMHDDHQAGRPLELGAIADAIFELAERHQLALPVARTITELARFRAAQRRETVR